MPDPTAQTAALTFLDRFMAANEAGDTNGLAGCFADVFLAGDPTGVRPVPREAFAAAVPRRRAAFAEAGVGAARLVASTVTELGEHYLLVSTEWMAPRLDGGEPLPLSSSFLLYRNGDTTTACAYLNHIGL